MADEKLTDGRAAAELTEESGAAAGKTAAEILAAVKAPDGAEGETEYEAALARAQRRARDEELSALANLALIRNGGFARRDRRVPGEGTSPEDLDERLRRLISDD